MDFNEKISRKSFIKAGTFALMTPMFSKINWDLQAKSSIGLQLYTLRNEVNKDLEGTLKKVSELGYQQVEMYGYSDGKYFGKSVKEMKALLAKYNLQSISGHYGAGVENTNQIGSLSNGWEKAVEDAAELGHKYVVCAYLTDNERDSIEKYKSYIDLFNKAGETAKKAGVQFAYHNHDFEFKPLSGQMPYDLIAGKTDPELVKLELDLYWTARAGIDPVALFKKYPGRFPLWHVKDMNKTDQSFAPVGTGSIDFKKIFSARKTAGLKQFFVEQDASKGAIWDDVTTSIKNVKAMKV